MNELRTKLQCFSDNTILVICVIMASSLAMRMYLYPYGIPLSFDALNAYFLYASDTSILGHFPKGLANNGWPGFLSIFFSIFHFETSMEYMDLQRIISISFSILTVIPVYYLGRKFFDKHYSILCAIIFAFEPRLIQNSLLGITEPMFLFLIAVSLNLFFAGNKKTYISFIVVGLSALVRSEGLFLLFGITALLIIQNRKQLKKMFFKVTVSVGLFIFTILPMSVIRFMINGSDSLIGRALGEGGKIIIKANQESVNTNLILIFVEGLKNPLMLLGWSSIPLFIFFIPASIIAIIKDRNKNFLLLIIILSFMMIPVFYGLSVGPDTRYIFPLYPLFSVISVYIIKKIFDKRISKKILLVMIIGSIVLLSSTFLYLKQTDLAHEKEAFQISKQVIQARAINDYGEESKYVRATSFVDKPLMLSGSLWRGPITFEINDYQSLQEFIDKNRKDGLDYIVVDGKPDKPAFLNDVFYNEQKYTYLKKVYDSLDYGYNYHVKIFKIDYEKFTLNTMIKS